MTPKTMIGTVAELVATALIGILFDRYVSNRAAFLALAICLLIIGCLHWEEIRPLVSSVVDWASRNRVAAIIIGGLAGFVLAGGIVWTVTRKHTRPIAVIPYLQRANVVITTLTFPAQGRPIPSDPSPFFPGKPFFVNIRFKNDGPIPAQHSLIYARMDITSVDEPNKEGNLWEAVKNQAKSTDEGVNSLLPGETGFITAQYPLEKYGQPYITEDDIQKIKGKKAEVLIVVIIKYQDAYGLRETHICKSFSGVNWSIWTDCASGHNEILP